MNSAAHPGKKPALCRYFASTGSCFYGDDCQFSHEPPTVGKVPDGNPERQSPTKDGGSIRGPLDGLNGDQFFNATFSNANGLSDFPPPYSRHKGNAEPVMTSTPENMKGFAGPGAGPAGPGMNIKDAALAEQFAAMNMTPNKYTQSNLKGRNAEAPEFVPKSMGTPGGLSHSASSPSFGSYAQMAAMGAASPHLPPPPTTTQEALGMAGVPFSTGASPLGSPGLSPSGSPLAARRNRSPVTPLQTNSTPTSMGIVQPPQMQMQENIGGTTFFYTEEELRQHAAGVVMPNFTMYPSILPHVAHMKPKANMPAFFMPEEIKMEMLQRHALMLAQIDPAQNPDIPQEVDNYHNLFPLEPPPASPMHKSSTFGYPTTCYKAINTKDGLTYALRRIHGFRLVNTKRMALIDLWKKIQHSNIVHLREVFTTKAFGDHSMVFVYDFHPASETMMSRHFSHTGANPAGHMNGFASGFGVDGSPLPSTGSSSRASFNGGKASAGEPRQHAGLLPESLIWAYIVQLTSALRTIHAHGLACRVMDPTKILLTDKSRVRLNCLGIFDVLTFDANQSNPLALMPHYQQDDLISLGKVVLALACNSIMGIQQENLVSSMDLVSRSYSADLKNLILYLLTNQTRLRSVNDIMPMIGARFYTQLDAAQLRNDVLENELAKEVENGRLFKLMCKLGVINERPEFRMDPAWSETGDRYMLKLYRDFLFHQVDDSGTPWLDMAHVVQCLNKLDAGVPEKICLMSRDEQSVLVVSYAELKQCCEAAFSDVMSSANANSAPPSAFS